MHKRTLPECVFYPQKTEYHQSAINPKNGNSALTHQRLCADKLSPHPTHIDLHSHSALWRQDYLPPWHCRRHESDASSLGPHHHIKKVDCKKYLGFLPLVRRPPLRAGLLYQSQNYQKPNRGSAVTAGLRLPLNYQHRC